MDFNTMTDTFAEPDTTQKRTENEARSRELQALYEISQTILSSLDIKTVLEGILYGALASGSFDIGVIRLLDASGQVLEPVASRGFLDPKNIRKHRVRDATTGKIIGRVMTEKEPLVVEKVPNWDGLRTLKQESVESAIIIPVRSGEKVLGVIQLGSRTSRKLQDDEIRLLKTIGSQMGIAVQKARLYGETQQNLERIRALHEIGQAITSTLDLRPILDVLLEKIDLFLPYAVATIRLLNRKTGEVEPVACWNLDEEKWKAETAGAGGLNRMLPENKAPVMVRNAQTDPRSLSSEFLQKHSLVSYLRVPLIAKNEVLGVLTFFTREEHEFSANEVEFLTMLARQAAIAIHNAQLYEQTKEQAVELEKDIIRRERTEEELKKLAAKLERSNRELQDFASVASHDLQEPLRKILAFGDRLKAKCADALSDEGCGYLQRMQNAARRMQDLINDLLTYSRVTTKAQPFVPVDLSKVTREVLTDLEVRIVQSGGRVEVGDLPTIDADPMQMRQLLQNLIGNALKFHRPDETPVVKIHGQLLNGRGRRLADSSPADELCQITVQDNGIGFDEKYRDRIFNVFQRLHSRSDYEGSGIGLAVCRKIARRHGGDVTATSTLGEGATFIVRLPIKQPDGENTQWMNIEDQSIS